MRNNPLEEIYQWLLREGVRKFSDVVDDVVRIEFVPGLLVKVRVVMVDGSFLDIYWSPSGKFSLHYERRHIDGRVFRHDNAPHPKHKHIPTFPKHYHYGSENNVVESNLPDEPAKAVEEFLKTIRTVMKGSTT